LVEGKRRERKGGVRLTRWSRWRDEERRTMKRKRMSFVDFGLGLREE